MQPLESLWTVLVAGFIGLVTLVISWITIRLQAHTNRLKNNMQRTLSMEDRLRAVEEAEQHCQENNRRLREQNTDQELRLRSQKFEIDRLQEQVTAIVTPVFITADLEGIIVDASDGIERLLGWRGAELIGKSVDVLIPEDYRDRHHAGMEQAKKTGQVRPAYVYIVAYALHRSGARVPVSVSLAEKCSEPRLFTAQLVYRHP